MNDIINKMKQSKSPVYVVVKKHAHSAAAIITTGAEKYFICRGAEMLHHQPHVMEISIKNVKKNMRRR
ncbi:MAG: ATP-dependent Clp protease proteolytic subunit [Cytophagales bacterium]|nr:ATP-dependent Clp protease proteolytic subunit [Cytophagales bacterium]